MQPIGQEAWWSPLQRALDVLTAQHRVTANNLANVNTPAFRAQRVDFQQELARSLATADPDALRGVRTVPGGLPFDGDVATAGVQAEPVPGAPARADGNTVDLEREMTGLAQANETYASLLRIAGKQLRITRYVISGGRG